MLQCPRPRQRRDRKTIAVNRAAREVYGLNETGVSSPDVARSTDARHPDGRPIDLEEMAAAQALRGEVVYGTPMLLTGADGQERSVVASGAPLRQNGSLAGAVVVWHDVTEQVAVRETLRWQNEELQALTAELEAYDFTVAHDLKNPLAIIVGSADLLSGILADLEGEGPRRMLRNILEGTRRMNDIVESLLLLAGTRSEEVPVEAVDMAAILERVCRGLEPEIARLGADLRCSCPSAVLTAPRSWGSASAWPSSAALWKSSAGGWGWTAESARAEPSGLPSPGRRRGPPPTLRTVRLSREEGRVHRRGD